MTKALKSLTAAATLGVAMLSNSVLADPPPTLSTITKCHIEFKTRPDPYLAGVFYITEVGMRLDFTKPDRNGTVYKYFGTYGTNEGGAFAGYPYSMIIVTSGNATFTSWTNWISANRAKIPLNSSNTTNYNYNFYNECTADLPL